MTDGQKLKQFIENQPRSVKSIYTEVGVSKAAWYEYYKAASMEPETKRKIERVLGRSIFNIDPDQKNAPLSDFKTNTEGQNQGARIDGLIETNRLMAAAMLKETENRDHLIKQNEAIISMAGQFENVQSEILQAFDAKVSAFLVAISWALSGKRYKSATEAQAALHKLFYGENKDKREKDIRDGSGK